MNDQDKINRWVVLENAIEKAIDGGWLEIKTKAVFSAFYETDVWDDWGDSAKLFVIELKQRNSVEFQSVEQLIYNKEFAKALWGESKSIKGNEPWQTLGWEHHLKNMVVAEDPIEYLAENLD